MTADLQRSSDLAAMSVRELLAELTRVEDRLNSERAALGYRANPEIARLQRRMRAISAQLHQRRQERGAAAADPLTEAAEADLVEQSIPVDADPDEEYPPEVQLSTRG